MPRIFACIPKTGYVGVGTVTGLAVPFEEAEVTVDGEPVKLSGLPLAGSYTHKPSTDDDDKREYVVPVEWDKTLSREHAVWEKGMFANQNSACKLRNRFTLERLAAAFDVELP
ncbi:MAG: hypothetical protein JO222_10310 [Frankiales bacterium]|nr:hypothetical protein [Frankiales bacterium]